MGSFIILSKIYCTLLKISDNRSVEEGKLVYEGESSFDAEIFTELSDFVLDRRSVL